MVAQDLQQDLAISGKSVNRVIDECVLTPIPGIRPAGENIRGLKLWVDLRTARPKIEDLAKDHDWQPANPIITDWASYRDLVERALCTRSKDLELGLFLTEASTRVFGFAGVRDGLWMLGGLITGFIDQGLFPEPEDGDLEVQYGKLDWLNEKLSDVIREIPLTRCPDPGMNYSLNYRDESRRQGGMITSADYEAAASAGNPEEYQELLASIKEARAELDKFEAVVAERFGTGSLSFTLTEETLDECQNAVQSILRRRQPATDVSTSSGSSKVQAPMLGSPSAIPLINASGTAADSWSECEHLARTGKVDRALSTMTALASAEPNGRIRFQRKLLLADLCLQTNRKKLGTSILQELNEIIEQHRLETWETSEIVGGVWARLVRCYRDQAAGTADQEREAEFYLKLSRLDPWQALSCGEPVRKDNR
jgi:type VI secretion system protein ImpA